MSMNLWKCYFLGMCLLSSCWAWSCWWVISKEFVVKWIEPFGSFYRGSDLVFYPVHLFVYIFYLEELLLLTIHRQHSPSLLKKATLTKIHPWACSSYRLRQNPDITFSRCSQTSPAHPFSYLSLVAQALAEEYCIWGPGSDEFVASAPIGLVTKNAMTCIAK